MKSQAVLFVSITLLLLSAVAAAQTTVTQKQTSVRTTNDEWTWRQTDNGRGLEARVKGQVEFNSDYSDIKSIAPGGSFRLNDTRGRAAKRFEVEPDANGSLQRAYYVDGRLSEFNAEARQWLSGLLIEMVRQGFDAPARVENLFRQGGAEAVLDEVTRLRSDYVKRVYLTTLLANHRLESVERVIRQAGREISSDYEKRNVLVKVAEQYLDDDKALREFMGAVGTVNSDYERGQALALLFKRSSLSGEQWQAMLKAIAGMSSDYEKAKLLIRAAESFNNSTALPAFFATADTIDSDYEQRRVLTAIVRNETLGQERFKLVARSIAAMSSDYEKAQVLMQVAANSKGDEEIRRMLVDAAKNINSEYERGRVLSAAFK